MKRMLIPFSMALLVHVLLLRFQGDWFQKRLFQAEPDPIALALTYVKPKAPPPPSLPPPSEKVEEKQAPVIPEIKAPPQPHEPPKKVEPERPPAPKPKVVKSKPPRIRKPKKEVVEKKTVVPPPRPEPQPQPPRKEEPVLSAPPSPPSSDREPRTEPLVPSQASPMADLKSDDEAQVAALTPDKPPREAIPLYRQNPPPPYPRIARRKGYEGTVVLEVLVGHDGRVNDLRVLQSCGHEVLDEAAADSVRSWLFEPGRIGEEPVEMWVKVPIRFHLKE